MSKRKAGTAAKRKPRKGNRRALWRGAVSFGLVYIPVHLYSAARESTLDLDLLDSRDFSPVGYQRYNKRTGKVVEWADIVKGFQYRKGEYVALSDEDFRQANVEASQTIDIDTFAERVDIPPEYYEQPYFLEPAQGGDKTYALLREALLKSGKVAIGSFVMRSRQHLCALVAQGRVLLLNTLRFAEELRPAAELDLPPANARSAKISPRELAMATRLIEEMSGAWKPEDFEDSYRKDLMRRIREKIRKRQTHVLTPEVEPEAQPRTADIIDLTAILRQSLESRGSKAAARSPKRRAQRSRPTGT
ncbi:MAG: Ku protein [Steroidobacteraceae bacterium]